MSGIWGSLFYLPFFWNHVMGTCRGRWTLTSFGSDVMADATTPRAGGQERFITHWAEVSERTEHSSPAGLKWFGSKERRLAWVFAVVSRAGLGKSYHMAGALWLELPASTKGRSIGFYLLSQMSGTRDRGRMRLKSCQGVSNQKMESNSSSQLSIVNAFCLCFG